ADRQRPGRAARACRQGVPPPGDRPRRRHRPGLEPGAGIRPAAWRRSGMRFPTRAHRIPHHIAPGADMKPVWIVDDDQSIRWVLEKALARAELSSLCFSSALDMLDALETG